MAAVRLDLVDARERLKPRREPYWQRIEAGQYIGFRFMTRESAGSWVARSRDSDTGKQRHLALGELSELQPSRRFDAARKAADDWFRRLGLGGSAEVVTVKSACKLYAAHVRADKGDDKADDIEARFRRWVDDDKIGAMELPKLLRRHVDAWRQAMAKTPAKVNRDDRDVPLTRARSPSTVNRDMAAIRAALNFAHDAGHVTNDMAWRVALRPIKNADGRRDAYLDRQQRADLINRAQPDVALLLKALALVPLRPGALASLTVASLDKRLGVLVIGKDKAGRDRRIKLPTSTAEFFAEQAKGKLPAAPLLTRADGKAWDKDSWKKPIKAAAQAAKLPDAITAYAMRHSSITDLVTGGLDLLTVAQLSGTSVAMIEKHYGHLRADHAAEALAKLAL